MKKKDIDDIEYKIKAKEGSQGDYPEQEYQ